MRKINFTRRCKSSGNWGWGYVRSDVWGVGLGTEGLSYKHDQRYT